MGKFSTYRYLELKEDTSLPHIDVRSRTVKQPQRFKKIFILLIVLALCVTYFLGLFASSSKWVDNLAKKLGYRDVFRYAIIIDAGSTGTRVLAYQFRVPYTLFGEANIELLNEYFEQVKPGLSAYADNPEKGAETVVELIKKAEINMPRWNRAEIPLIVRATAGLRLLPEDTAQSIIHHVAKATSRLGYLMPRNSVAIMDGADEGIYIWYTVNLLQNSMEGEPMAALDLGGGSTQITFKLEENERNQYPKDYQYTVPAGKRNVTLFTHSGLKLGLMAARHGVFRMEAANDSTNNFVSVCVDPITVGESWTYGNKEYIVSGADHGNLTRQAVFNRCHDLVVRYVRRTAEWEPEKPPRGAVAAMSYFYDVAADSGIIDVMNFGGTVTVKNYKEKALHACSASNVEQPWACIDLVYVVALLQDSYKIRDNDKIYLMKKIKNHEVSWALGLAYTSVMKQLDEEQANKQIN